MLRSILLLTALEVEVEAPTDETKEFFRFEEQQLYFVVLLQAGASVRSTSACL